MGTPQQSDRDLFRILLYRGDATELLVEASPEGLRLPSTSVPAHTRVAEEVTNSLRGLWNLETYCLFMLPSGTPSDGAARYIVLEACRHEPAPLGMRWLAVASCSALSFDDPADFAAIENALTTLDQHRRSELAGAFGKPGWLPVVMQWVQAQVVSAGLRLTGEFCQLNACPTFSLIRFETDGPALWFKAVGEPNLHEYRITLKLASAFPDFVPRILGSHPGWNAWAAVESDGSPLDANSNMTAWLVAAENLALLQISSFGGRFELINAGCRDLRPSSLVGLVDPFLDAMTELMERQTKLAPAPLSRQELVSLGRDIKASLRALDECAVPHTLGHLDLNPGNLLVRGTRCVFLDWAEAYVGPPFFAFQYLLENLRRLHGEDANREKSLLSSYATLWNRFASSKEIAGALRVTPLLAAFAYAARIGSWRNRESMRPESARSLRSLTRRMRREANALDERRTVCIP
jgi:hypothetical protein